MADSGARYNEQLRVAERRLCFNVVELQALIAHATGHEPGSIHTITKLAEGGSYRIFEAKLPDGASAIVRLPYKCTEPRRYGIASEVATMEFLRLHGCPIPKVLAWDASCENALGCEYMILERAAGQELSETWTSMDMKRRLRVVRSVVEMEKRMFDIPFPASGSIYFRESLDASIPTVEIPNAPSGIDLSRFCIGPSTEYLWWHGNRSELSVNRGPCRC